MYLPFLRQPSTQRVSFTRSRLAFGTRLPSHKALLCLGLAALALSSGLAAQSVQITVVDSMSGVPVVGGFVVLLDTAGAEVRRALNPSATPLVLRAPRSGRYRIRSERIGYRAAVSPLLRLRVGETARYELRVAALPIQLETIEVEGTGTCRVNPEQAGQTAAVWEEARKALEAAIWTAAQGSYWYRSQLYQRELDIDRRRVVREETREQSGYYRAPFASVSAERLADSGYVIRSGQGWIVYAPDAAVLTNTGFLNTHCFRVVRETTERERRVGLEFEPIPGREETDVSGTLWIDEESSELRSLEFQYDHLPGDVFDSRLGGTLHFMATPAGAWIVREWQLRLPIMQRANVGVRRGRLQEGIILAGFQDTGGEVLEIRGADGVPVYIADVAMIAGRVIDEVSGGPLAGSRVFLLGTGDTATADAAGRFVLSRPYAGDYQMTFSHPRLDSLGYVPEETPVTLRRGHTETVTLALPRPEVVLRSVCGGGNLSPDDRAIVGVVRHSERGPPLVGAEVTARWRDFGQIAEGRIDSRGATVLTDSTGFYRLCGVPVDRRVTLVARYAEYTSNAVELVLDESGAERWIWRRDLILGSLHGAPAVVRGKVTEAQQGGPVSRAEVLVAGTEWATTTDSAGRFELAQVPAGIHRVTVRHIAYAPRYLIVTASAGDTIVVPDGLLAMGIVQLPPVVVTANAVGRRRELAEFEERRVAVTGSFLTREEFEEMGNPQKPTDVIRRMSGFRVQPNPGYMKGSWPNQDTRRWLITTARQIGGPRTLGGARGGGECAPLFFLDGLYLGNANDVDIDAFLPLSNVQAVEAYSSAASLPLIFNRPGATCGVIVFWTG
jgi:hypothetical protein